MNKVLRFLTLTALLLALIAAPTALATGTSTSSAWDQLLLETLKSVENLSDMSSTVTVSGSSYVNAVPDMAVIQVGVTIQAPTVGDAQDQANRTMEEILVALKALGIPETDIATSNYSVNPVYNYSGDTRQLTGYQVSNQLTVTVTDFALINQVIDTAVTNGANEIYGLTFGLIDSSALYQQALTASVADAQTKAATLAQASGKTLGGLISVTEETAGYSVPVYAKLEMDAGGAATNIQAGQTQVSATVTVVYELK